MALTVEDKNYLINIGYLKEDLLQIEEASKICKYEDLETEEKLGIREVLEILPREKWISGIARAAFHWTSVR